MALFAHFLDPSTYLHSRRGVNSSSVESGLLARFARSSTTISYHGGSGHFPSTKRNTSRWLSCALKKIGLFSLVPFFQRLLCYCIMQVILGLSKKEAAASGGYPWEQKYCKLLTINFLILYILKDTASEQFIHECLYYWNQYIKIDKNWVHAWIS